MKISSAGISFLADWEGVRLHLYNDPYNCTIGVGHLVHLGYCDGRASEVPYLQGITRQQAEALFAGDLVRFEKAVNDLGVVLTQNQFDALVSFSFNLGAGIFTISPGLVSAIRNGLGATVCRELRRYVTEASTGNVLDALVRRRAAECALYNKYDEESDPMLKERIEAAGLFLELETKLTMGLAIPAETKTKLALLLGGRTPRTNSQNDLLRVLARYAAARALGGEPLDGDTIKRLRWAIR